MRILFCSSPGVGHSYPLVPTAWALRAEGHDVLLASTGPLDELAASGLPVVDITPSLDLRSFFIGGDNEGEDSGDSAARTLAALADAMTPGTLQLADRFRPDLVVQTQAQSSGRLAAALLGVACVEHRLGIMRSPEFAYALQERMRAVHVRHGAPADAADPALDAALVEVGPPSLTSSGTAQGLATRYTPYNGGAVLPGWLWDPADRPRIAVTLGTVIPHAIGAAPLLARVVEAARRTDAEFLLVLGDGVDPAGLGPLPANVRTLGRLPLNALLPSCAAIVHHGGAGTTLTAAATGVPQLILPTGVDHFVNAKVVGARGIGLYAAPDQVDRDVIEALLNDASLRDAAQDVRRENEALASPGQSARELLALAGAR
jgi:UDP:flavonoid glycosyltransferase YjiC (YdhE family)